jgi:Asp-tRNA(Asn)/Glu-tRNA(Gln) amidotransferase A subunit family amidase
MGWLHQLANEREGKPAETLARCRARIAEIDPRIRAWVSVEPQPATGSGPLDGIPFGVKDIYETAGLATAYGSPLFAGRRTPGDAALVAALRAKGGIVLGKTHTTAFAYFDPAPTRNPRDPGHTPGGSSSGSAAAVAAGMVPFALGSQTQGSVIRPASFCGIAGFKPTFGLLDRAGMLPFAPSLDTPGFFTEDAEDMATLWRFLNGDEQEGTLWSVAAPRRIEGVEPEMMLAFKDAVGRLNAAGFRVALTEMPVEFAGLAAAVSAIQAYEGARSLEPVWREHRERVGVKLAAMIERGLAMPAAEYEAARTLVEDQRKAMRPLFEEFGLVATPAANGPAPRGLESTGDPRQNAPWTGLGVPVVTVPMPVRASLPMGLQLAAAWSRDRALVSSAVEVEKVFTRA